MTGASAHDDGEDSMLNTLLYYGVGVIIGIAIFLIYRQTALLNELAFLAHDQRRMTIGAIRRELAQSKESAKETAPHA